MSCFLQLSSALPVLSTLWWLPSACGSWRVISERNKYLIFRPVLSACMYRGSRQQAYQVSAWLPYPLYRGGGLFSCIVIDNRFLLVSGKFHSAISPFPLLWVLCLFPSATVGYFACSFVLANLVFIEWSCSVSFRLLMVAVSSAQVFSDRAFNFFKVSLTICFVSLSFIRGSGLSTLF